MRGSGGERGSEGGGHENTGTMRWLLTYADMLTLLMVFFVVLYALSQPNANRYLALRKSLATAFLGKPAAASIIQFSRIPAVSRQHLPQPAAAAPQPSTYGSQPPVPSPEPAALETLEQRIESVLRSSKVSGVTVRLTKEGLDVSFTDRGAFFEKAHANLRPRFQAVLRRLAPILASVPNQIRVEGYTDNEPCHCPKYPTSWDLAAARAVNVTVYLRHQQLDPHRLAAVSFGQWHPRYPNNSPANMALNRSVDLVVLPRAVASQAP